MNKIIFLTLFSFLFLLISCMEPQYIFIKPKPYDFQKTKELPRPSLILVDPKYSIFEAYIKVLRSHLQFHNEQIDNYFNSFKETDEKKEEN